MLRVICALLVALFFIAPAYGQNAFQDLVQTHAPQIIKGSVKTAPAVIADIQATKSPAATRFLQNWQSKDLWYRRADDLIVTVTTDDNKTYTLLGLADQSVIGTAQKSEIKQIKPNSGLRGLLGTALVGAQLASDDLATRRSSLESLARDPAPEHLAPLRAALNAESDVDLRAKMLRLERLLTLQYDTDTDERIAAINGFAGDLGLDVRARLNPLLDTRLQLSQTPPAAGTFARMINPANDETLSVTDAYDMLVANGWASAKISPDDKRKTLIANIENGAVGGVDIADLNTDENRNIAYAALVDAGIAPVDVSDADIINAVETAYFYDTYSEQSPAVIAAAQTALKRINTKVGISQGVDLFLDGLSLASIFFLAAIGLAITFGVMRVINMAHGEFIMMGAYTGFVVQQVITNYTLSIIIAIPAAFAVTFAAGVAMERLIIRHLYHRPLETLLATFGVSIALQQLAKNIFGTQARPLTSPDWLGGAWQINDVIAISWIRVAIFVLSILFFLMLWFTLNKTRLGLETRAVTQNPRMAASMGINPDKINMLTFGLGSGIAGIAGVAIGLFAKVTSELGSDYIVQSFMTVVVGGVGNIWGTLAGAAMIGFLQKGIEWMNPSNTLAAQTFMIIFIIIFIQFRPRGIIALKGRAAGD
ncbi:branched-chain amino acid ABC transporter permease [Amylibacter ulvae]|uniref:Branched-chain amino acid ABC transporter permease n=1 Tax=Paramylibacter ulvae TaxID=1651968 RepID=A0ABQ3D0W6_9RHOB|nr:urea ABC transporter permease subunit UrtB [Amylibacter ulvae]GHA52941.1 branched-chain amino acid ABC transporter permease [Amylibacter ulvae]